MYKDKYGNVWKVKKEKEMFGSRYFLLKMKSETKISRPVREDRFKKSFIKID
jgi:hypothetical protein